MKSGPLFVGEAICRASRGSLEQMLLRSFSRFSFPLLSLHLDLQLTKDSSNHRKISDIIEALQICKQAAQTASA